MVVLPFANLGGQPEDDWLGAGIAETVATDLRTAGATVIVSETGRSGPSGNGPGNGGSGNGGPGNGGSGNGESGNGESDADGRTRGWSGFDGYSALGADWVVEGGHQRSGDRLRLTARIVAVETGGIAYSAHVDGTRYDVFEAQDAIAEALVERLVPSVPAAAAVGGRAAGGTFDGRTRPEVPRFSPVAPPLVPEGPERVAPGAGVAPSRPLGPADGVTGTLALADAPSPAGASLLADASRPGEGPPPTRSDPPAASGAGAQPAGDRRA
ncbi:MAG: hypothetical protein OXH04_03955, partial [Acidobacteria bacterium]|nr:hypothetical protein [Acidobacteriota bacterium]